jgi:hypothetical protein
MSNLLVEIGLRLVKPLAATLIGALVFVIAVALGEPPSVALALLAWLAGAALILLIGESPL